MAAIKQSKHLNSNPGPFPMALSFPFLMCRAGKNSRVSPRGCTHCTTHHVNTVFSSVSVVGTVVSSHQLLGEIHAPLFHPFVTSCTVTQNDWLEFVVWCVKEKLSARRRTIKGLHSTGLTSLSRCNIHLVIYPQSDPAS